MITHDQPLRRENWFFSALRGKLNVMRAVMLRDMRTRFFNHGLGFLVVPLWPLAHMWVLIGIYALLGRTAPYGDTLRVFFATGLLPTLSFMYVSRMMTISLLLNRPMLAFPAVKPTDILFGRAALEIVGCLMTTLFMFLILLALGDHPYPFDIVQAAYVFGATVFLAVGVGIFVGVLSTLIPLVATIYILVSITVYILSGVLFLPSSLPSQLLDYLSWNPVLHLVEWMRVAFYEGYPDQVLDKAYPFEFGLVSLLLGLGLERVLRGRLLEG